MDSRPRPIYTSRSFTRMDSFPTSPVKKRASTLQDAGIPSVPEARHLETSQELVGKPPIADVFENAEVGDETDTTGAPSSGPDVQLPSTFDDLPIEIRSFTERFLNSLSAKVHPQPLSADALSELFQDFYERAASQIATHIASLGSRIGRDKSPTATNSTKAALKSRSRAGSGATRSDTAPTTPGGEMLTVSEVADRKKARRLLELKRIALEEAVERAVTEKIYERIWKHRSTDDDARDEKLRSRTAALALVGIGLRELHMDSDPKKEDVRKATEEKEEEIYQSLASAREALQKMDDEHHPLGKLKHLTEAHKNIVETLSQLFPSSSSADEILPTLIYTLITSPPEGINAVSNLNFIQRFRTSSKIDGEAAYCLVNLEAAISFLETVDLSSLRADELPEGPLKVAGQPLTLTSGPTSSDPVKPATVQTGITPVSVLSKDTTSSPTEASRSLPLAKAPTTPARPPMSQRRISALMQAQADRIEAGRDNFLNAADKIYESINGTLDNSLQFVFGRFKDQNTGNSPLPKTLEDARKLVSSPRLGEEDEMISTSGRSSPGLDDPLTGKPNDKLAELIGGRKQLRDRSADSTLSGGSGKRVAFTETLAKEKQREDVPAVPGTLFATINPLNRFNVASLARFGRAASIPGIASPSPSSEKQNKLAETIGSPTAAVRDGDEPTVEKTRIRESATNSGNEDLNAREALAELRRTKPPKKRFLDVQSAADLKIGEVEELLLEYRRLAKAIGEAVAL